MGRMSEQPFVNSASKFLLGGQVCVFNEGFNVSSCLGVLLSLLKTA